MWLGILIWPNIPAILVALLAVLGVPVSVAGSAPRKNSKEYLTTEAAPRLPVGRRRFATTCTSTCGSVHPPRRSTPVSAASPRAGEDRLHSPVIATDAAPRELPGMPRLADVNTLRSLDNALALREALRPGAWVVIIGAGFIGSRPGRAGHGRVRTPERSHGDCGRSARWCAPSAGRWEPR